MIFLYIFIGIIIATTGIFSYYLYNRYIILKRIENISVKEIWTDVTLILNIEKANKKKLKKIQIYDFSKYQTSNIIGATYYFTKKEIMEMLEFLGVQQYQNQISFVLPDCIVVLLNNGEFLWELNSFYD